MSKFDLLCDISITILLIDILFIFGILMVHDSIRSWLNLCDLDITLAKYVTMKNCKCVRITSYYIDKHLL